MSSDDLYDRVRFSREGSAVERCHAHEHLRRYSIGHHSLDMVTLITLCWREGHNGALPRAELLIAAAFHDIPERFTGDLPSPVKRLLDGKVEELDQRVLKWLGVEPILTEDEAEYLLAADRIELWLWCWEEARRGNVAFRVWIDEYTAHYTAHPPPEPFRIIMATVLDHGQVEKLNENMITEMFGT